MPNAAARRATAEPMLPKPDDAERALGEGAQRQPGPVPGAHVGRHRVELAREQQHVAEYGVGHGIAERTGRVADPDAARSRRRRDRSESIPVPHFAITRSFGAASNTRPVIRSSPQTMASIVADERQQLGLVEPLDRRCAR